MPVTDQLDRLAAFEPAPYPVVSLYLNTQPGQTGRDQYQTFVRKELSARARTYGENSPERESLDRDVERILVFALGELVTSREVKGVKTKRTSQGGWSQARFQRHISNFHMQHAKEVVDALDRLVQQESITQILLAGDEVITPQLRGQMPKHLA